MNKTIEKIEEYKAEKIQIAIDRAGAALEDAKACYRDTGYDRYYNKMQRLEKEIEELEAYRDRDKAIAEAIAEKQKVRRELDEIKKDLGNKLFYLLAAIPECSEAKSIKTYLEKL